MDNLCGCIACVDERIQNIPDITVYEMMMIQGPGIPGWRYACVWCGNKRCPKHQNHIFKCTGSNEPNQIK